MMLTCLFGQAQTLNVVTGSVTTQFPAAQTGAMTYSEQGTALTILGKTYSTADIDRLYTDDTEVEDNTVSVAYDGTSATVTIAGNVAQYVSATVSGAHVSIIQSSDVSADTCGEITYSLSGESSDGAFYLEGSFKATLALNGVTLTNPSGPAINIQNGKRIAVSIKKGTTNTLADGTGGDWKGAFRCKGHTEFKGKGTLNIYGYTAHAIWSKEYVEMKNCTINVLAAVKDGLNCNQYFLMESGTLSIAGVGDDGLQVSYETDDDGNIEADEENTGALTVQGGTLQIQTTAAGSKGMKAEGPLTIAESDELTVVTVTNSGGVDTSDASDLTSSACVKSDTSITIDGGTITLTNTGQGGRAMNCENTIDINGGVLAARAEGSNYGSSSNGKGGWHAPGWGGGGQPGGGQPGGGSTTSDGKNAKGIKAKGNLTITGGSITVYSANHEGIESKAALTISGGTVYAKASDDAINSTGDMTISGGSVYAYSTSNDGLDANGNMYIKGGTAIAFGAGNAETGIDIDEQHKLYITGGYLLGIGGRIDSSFGSGTQAYGYTTSSASYSGGYIVLSQGDTRLFAVKCPTSSYSGIVLCSAPSMSSGTSYSLGTASSVSGDEVNGFIASPTVSSVTSKATFTARK